MTYRVGDPAPLNPDGSVAWPAPDPSSPFFCHGPTLVSFSGGRTSGLMLFLILWAHGGELPPYVYVLFANTGREHPKTLRFVNEVSIRWNVRIIWVEWRPPGEKKPEIIYPVELALLRGLDKAERQRRVAERKRVRDLAMAATRFEIVGFNSANRDGRWFAELIRRKQYLPNVDMRYCTEKLKVETMKWFMVSMGFETWFNMVGLRADEPARVVKQVIRNNQKKERWVSGSPLFLAGIIERIVLKFWLGRNLDPEALVYPLPQGFDLGIRSYRGNCIDCFLKGRGKRARVYREEPWAAEWSLEQERLVTERRFVRTAYIKQFDKRESVAQLVEAVARSPELAELDDGPEIDCTGDTCTIDEGMSDADFQGPEAEATIVWLRDRMRETLAMPRPAAAHPPAIRDLFEAA